ncbi:aldehyde dehydrogenase family protein [Streptomyces sp. NPDC002795]|uniref:aldehyde dehydrogenase family protein n=1 Tax=Streptomyces sp. NPDC002795 TaxID=3364665 RepID=UPI003674225A
MSDRLTVLKTYKLYVGGKFPRSESGRVYEVTDGKSGEWLANAPLSSRKDGRDAVVAARKAFGAWSGATAYNRGQVLYRVAEMLEGRREQFVREVSAAEGLGTSSKSGTAKAAAVVDAAIDRWVWYAGWTDKIGQVVGGANPVAGPFLNLSTPEPTGVVAVLAPQDSSFLGLISVIAPVIASGNTVVVITSEKSPLPALSLGEVLATSDVPGGVVNILSGKASEIAPSLAAHQDVNGIDLTGADAELAKQLEIAAADNLKRVRRPQPVDDFTADPGTDRLTYFLETKTVWHPTGSLGASGSAY